MPRVGTSEILAKPIIRPAGTARVGIHNATTVHGRTVNTAGRPTSEEATVIEDPSYANLQMNHYFTKSWQEFQAKRSRATTSTHSFGLPEVPFDIPAQVDHVIDRWRPRTRALMEEMASLPASPSRYGSRLRLTGFPSSDMFGQEATAVVTNEAAGVDGGTQEAHGALVAHARRAWRHGARRGLRVPGQAGRLPWLAARGPADRLAAGRGHLGRRRWPAAAAVEGGTAGDR